ncbi:MAG: ATP-binding protein [Acidobacteriota bacterium]
MEEELDRLFILSLDLLCVAGVDGFFRHINPAFVRVLGYSEEELLSRSFLEFVHPEDREGTLREVERLAQGLPVVDFQNRYRAQDGTYRWLAWRSAPWAERGLIYAVARDITEQRRTQELLVRQSEELARSNADLEQFAKVASHDLRTPLRHVANLATWIEEDMPTELPENVRSNLRRLRGMVRPMEKLTDGILSYARAGRDRGKICTVDTDSLLKELVHLLAPPEEFTVSWDPGMPVFETDASALEQVLRNLIDNAIKHHGRRDGRVTIAARELPDSYEFTVSDDGPGIPVHLRGEIFAMFRKGRSGDEAEGNGIGLALVQRIVEGYQRRVWVESTEGGGATLRFTWPRTIGFEEG